MIVHLDADAFFASVEQAADVRLRGKPVAVGGLHRGVVASASYEARKLGIYTTMPTARARKLCPKLIVVPGDFEKYERFSRLMFSYAFDFTPDVEISSIDEGYFDLGGNRRRPPGEVAEIIARAIRDSLKISVSEGVGSNKLIAQVASKLRKPAALIEVPAGEEKTFLNPLENRWLPGVGPRAAIELNSAGLRWIGQIAATPPEILSVVAGNGAPQLWRFANGVDDRPVVPEPPDAKSYGRQETFEQDVTDEAFILATLRQMTDRLMAKARGDRKSVRTVTVKIRYNDMEECSRSVSLEEPTHLESDVYAVLGDLLKKAWTRRVSLRLVSVKLSHVYDGVFAPELPLDPPTRARHNRARLVPAIDEVRQRIGRDALMRGHDLWLREREGKPRVATDRPGACQLSRRRAPAPRQVSLPPPLLLNVKSYYSLLDSTLSLPEIVARAAASGAKTIAVTDPNLYGAIEFYSLAKAAGLRPIIAAEVSCSGRRWNLYVKNAAGYRNLCRILSQSVLRPEFLADHAQGLIRADPDDPRLFLPEIRYAKPEHRRRYDVIQSIRTLTMLDEAHPEKRRGGEFHFPGPDRLAAAERKDPAAWRAAAKLAEACEFEFEPPRLRFPRFHPPDGTSAHVFLRRLAEEGWNRRYPNGHHAHALSRAQLEQELAIIERVGYEEYFLSAWEILQECRARGIPWLTRGSAA
ncbi:MAG: PHP domain-containing protein, partial [Verrucomicrobiae bacterium]|nr:PHP domain-containing protein [Verrucomicrobiae bacterium]